MVNLLVETKDIMNSHGKTPSDVRWVGEKDGWCTWDEYADQADRDYDDGYGGEEVSRIIIVGDDWWLERHEYDGSEWWEYKKLPVKPVERTKVEVWGRY